MIAKNYIGDAGAEALVAAATTNAKIKALYICITILIYITGNPLLTEATKVKLRAQKRSDLEMYPYIKRNPCIVMNYYLSGPLC